MTRQVLEAACNDAVFNLVAMRKSKTAIANELRPLLRSKLQSLPWLRVGIGIFKLQTASRLTDALGAVAASSTIMSTTSAMPFKALVHTTLFVGHWMIEFTTRYAVLDIYGALASLAMWCTYMRRQRSVCARRIGACEIQVSRHGCDGVVCVGRHGLSGAACERYARWYQSLGGPACFYSRYVCAGSSALVRATRRRFNFSSKLVRCSAQCQGLARA